MKVLLLLPFLLVVCGAPACEFGVDADVGTTGSKLIDTAK